MTGSEKIDRVTALIESEIKKDKSASEIADNVAREIGNSTRDLSTIFSFMTGKTLIDYIKERKLNASYEHIIDGERFDAQTAVTLSGLGDQSALIKKFNNVYGMTPKEAHAKKDRSLVKARMKWNDFSHVEIQEITSEENDTVTTNNTVFGLARTKYEEVKEAIGLQELYGFDELQSEIAYYIYQTYDFPLKETFRFVDEYDYDTRSSKLSDDNIDEDLKELLNKVFSNDVVDDEPEMERTEYYNYFAKGDADDPEIRYAYFVVGVKSIPAIYNLIDKLHALGDNDITELEPELIEMCAYEDFDARFCKKAVAYYLDNATDEYGDDAFEEYVGYLLNGQYIEDAFDNIWHTEGWDDYPYMSAEEYKHDIQEYDPDDPFEKWAAEETDYSDKY